MLGYIWGNYNGNVNTDMDALTSETIKTAELLSSAV